MGDHRGFLERVGRNRGERRKKIPRLLRQAREELGLTQAEVAEVLGWRQSDVSKMEAGERTPDVVELEDFAVMCGKHLDYFNTWEKQLDEDTVNRSVVMKANEFPYRLEEVRRKSANRRFYRKREVKMTSEQLAAVEAARARWKYYQKKPTSMGEAPFVEASKAGVKAEKLTTEHAGKARAKGISLFQLAGKPTKEQFQMVYGERGHSMTWAQRAAAGVTAEKFQEALRAKQQAKQTAVTRLAASKIT